MQLRHDVDAVADRLADSLERLERAAQVGGRDVLAAGLLGGIVERPDLHRANAHVEQALRHLLRPREEALQVLVLALLSVQPEVGRALHRSGLHVAVAGAGVVGPHGFPHPAAEQPAKRQADRLAEDVPEGEVDGRAAAHLGAAAGKAEVAHQVALMALDVPRVLPQQVRCDGLVHGASAACEP
jgi:hypothetical protein